MKNYIFTLASAAVLFGSCEVEDKYYGKEVADPAEKLLPAYSEDWTAHADKVDEVLISEFMDTSRGTFWASDQDRLGNSWYCYWPQAHAMDVLIDAYLRISSGDARRAEYADYMSKWYDNHANNYSNSYWGSCGFGNAYTDDSEWIILTLIRMYEATGERKYLEAAETTYAETVISRWTYDENGGGLRWSMDSDNSKNACSNGPGILCAMRLWANETDAEAKAGYLADAKKIYNWLSSTLYNPLTGAVSDNMSNGTINGGALTYNQGTFMGAAHELFKATGDAKYMSDAARAARYTMTNLVTDGILNNEGSGDNALFKGIFVRYAMNIWKDASVDAADAGLRQEIEDFLIYNGLVCWTEGVDKSEDSRWFFGASWTEAGSQWEGLLNEQVSASTMIEAMALLIGA